MYEKYLKIKLKKQKESDFTLKSAKTSLKVNVSVNFTLFKPGNVGSVFVAKTYSLYLTKHNKWCPLISSLARRLM